MNLICELSDSLLLLYVEFTLVNSVCHYSISELSTSELVKNETVLTCIDNSTIVKCLKFLCKLSLLCKICKCLKHICVNLLCSKVVSESLCHWDVVLLDTLSAIVS